MTKKNNNRNSKILHGTRVQYMKQLRNKFDIGPLPALHYKRNKIMLDNYSTKSISSTRKYNSKNSELCKEKLNFTFDVTLK